MLIIYALAALGILGLLFGLFLGVAARFFAVDTDPRVEAVKEELPGANCGACGYAGCANFAEAVVSGDAKVNGCIPGGDETSKAIAGLLGQEVGSSVQPVATVFCIGDSFKTDDKFIYDGVADCEVAGNFLGGFKTCSYGCLGFGNCVKACLFDAIKMGEHGLPFVDIEKCTGCGLCVNACPRTIIQMLPKGDSGHLVLCNSHERGKTVSRACEVGCIACKACVKVCPEEAIVMEDNLAVIDLEKCTDCGKCVEKCPPVTIYRRNAVPTEEQALAYAAVKAAESA